MNAPIDHATFDRLVTAEPDTLATHARTLAALAAGLDHSFVQAGTALGSGIEVTDRIVTALAGVEAALDDGAAGTPGDGLVAVAARLSGLPQEQAVRRTTFAPAGAAARSLVDHIGEIFQTLRLLGIYAMNVKVAAMGAADLVAIMDEMTTRMTAGEADIRQLQTEIALLSASLDRIAGAERALTTECARALPAAPTRLENHAGALRRYRHGAVDVARRSGMLASTIRTQVGTALGALQIGDITRQRLEHVVTALEMLGEARADDAGMTEDHVLSLLADQLNATADDFDREAGSLVAALIAIVPQAGALRDLQANDTSQGSSSFLRDLEASVTEIEALTRRLRSADAETEAAATTIVRLVDAMVARTAMVRRLQRHVQQLAFNIDLKSRRLESNGGIIVAADYIRRVANQLDDAAIGLTAAIGTLESIGQAARAANIDTIDPGAMLTVAMDAIREGAMQTDRAADAAGDAATRVLRMLTGTSADLRDKIDAAGTIRTIAAELATRADRAAAVSPDEDSPLHILLPRIAALYTMASEREVHQRHLLPGMAAVHVESTDDADDDLFDDGLF
ncbi:hypothetical protein [Sphingomonas mollis]|uniref:Methyl-accepting chemotaxis protein n=1 Tax=Sphingomonas mollis TaxID=2795726 RepID=A0ABS0XQP1_9SPHN|nr:hypothetical protein [Sphingomonas sp. BT553]MBJ6122350.1 hypothetical protein [Sphingomonas sp. BT553]